MSAAQSGTIFSFDSVRGYGFIVPDGGGEDVFVHANDLLDDKGLFTPGTPVEFEVTENERGPKAFAVRKVGDAPAGRKGPRAESFDDGLCDVLSPAEFKNEITDILLAEVPELTGAQIVRIRESLLRAAHRHGWTED